MEVYDELMAAAQVARIKLDADRGALVAATNEFEQMVQRLADAGASPEELVDALGISTVTVNRILGGKGTDLLTCSFCGRSQKEVREFITGPGVYICDDCLSLAEDAAATMEEQADDRARMIPVPGTAESETCGFCGKARNQVAQLVSGRNRRTICSECLDLFREIVMDGRWSSVAVEPPVTPHDLEQLLAPLPDQDREVLRLRFGLDRGEPRTLEEVAELLGLTRSAIRAVEERAMENLKTPGSD